MILTKEHCLFTVIGNQGPQYPTLPPTVGMNPDVLIAPMESSQHQPFPTNHLTGTPSRTFVASRLGNLSVAALPSERNFQLLEQEEATNLNNNTSAVGTEIEGLHNAPDEDTSVEVHSDEEADDDFSTSVSDEQWIETLQEGKCTNPKYETNRCFWPLMWKMVGLFLDDFKKADFFKTRKLTNPADFKGQLVQHLLTMRNVVERSEVPQKYLAGINSTGNKYKKNLYYYSKEAFLKHCVESYKYDIKSKLNRDLILPNDICRFVEIATRECNKDDMLKLSAGKAQRRSDIDGALNYQERIFLKLSVQFNDPNLKFTKPKRAIYLASYDELDPNDMARILIKRDYIYMMKVWKYMLPLYNATWQKWTMGTGGGPGAEENFQDWENRKETEKFADYAEHGSCDWQAYAYMCDKRAGFILNAINDPAPTDTVREDCDGGHNGEASGKKSPKRRKTAQDKLAATAENFNEQMMKNTLEMVRDTFADRDDNNEVESSVSVLQTTVNLINSLNEQIDILEERMNE